MFDFETKFQTNDNKKAQQIRTKFASSSTTLKSLKSPGKMIRVRGDAEKEEEGEDEEKDDEEGRRRRSGKEREEEEEKE